MLAHLHSSTNSAFSYIFLHEGITSTRDSMNYSILRQIFAFRGTGFELSIHYLFCLLIEMHSSHSSHHSFCCSVVESSPTLCNLMNFSTSASFIERCLSEPLQIHVHWSANAVYPSQLLSFPSVFSILRSFPNESRLLLIYRKHLLQLQHQFL